MTHVLLLEPDVALGRTYQRALEHAGYSVDLSRTAQDALDAAESRTPGIVVLELQLASHSGVEFLYEFRSYSEWQAIPVIVNTHMPTQALAGVESALHQNLGVTTVLHKSRTSLTKLASEVAQQTRAAA